MPVYTSSHAAVIQAMSVEIPGDDLLDENSAYVLLTHPLAGKSSLGGYEFPDPDDAGAHFDRLGEVIRTRYPDRFVDGFVDAGIFLTTQLLVGIEEFLYKRFLPRFCSFN